MDQTERMMMHRRVAMTPAEPGDNVTIPIPLVDQGRCDQQYILGVIRSRDETTCMS